MGWHTCEICGRADGHGEIALEHAGARYVAPVLIIHYVERHHYLPPEPFLAALRDGTPISPDEDGSVVGGGGAPGYVHDHDRDRGVRRLLRWLRR